MHRHHTQPQPGISAGDLGCRNQLVGAEVGGWEGGQ
jgi:hypothetical protein